MEDERYAHPERPGLGHAAMACIQAARSGGALVTLRQSAARRLHGTGLHRHGTGEVRQRQGPQGGHGGTEAAHPDAAGQGRPAGRLLLRAGQLGRLDQGRERSPGDHRAVREGRGQGLDGREDLAGAAKGQQ